MTSFFSFLVSCFGLLYVDGLLNFVVQFGSLNVAGVKRVFGFSLSFVEYLFLPSMNSVSEKNSEYVL